MARRMLSLVVIAGTILGVSLFAAPSLGNAGTINCITVANTAAAGAGGLGFFTGQFGGPTAGCPGAVGSGNTWNTGAPIVIPEGQFLILTQNPGALTGAAAFNFDTTDRGGVGSEATYRLFINQPVALTPPGGGIVDTSVSPDPNAQGGPVLSLGGHDDLGFTTNEASEWVKLNGGGPGGTFVLPGGIFNIWVGYADNLHPAPNGSCLDADGDCLPDNLGFAFGPSANVQFIGDGAAFLGPPFIGHSGTSPCTATSGNSCWDAGAILIQEVPGVPEPSSALLLGVGLLGMTAYGRIYLRKKSSQCSVSEV